MQFSTESLPIKIVETPRRFSALKPRWILGLRKSRSRIITRFPETAGQINAEDPIVIAELLRQMRFTSYRSVPVFSDVLKILAKESGLYVVTGSLYLAGEMYRISE